MKLSKLKDGLKMRHVAGVSIPRQNTTSFGMRAALKKGGSSYAGESGEVEGSPARVRLDRARACGGKVMKRAEGGSAGERMQAARKKRDEASTERNKQISNTAMSGGALAALTAATMRPRGIITQGLRALNAGLGASSGVGALTAEGRRQAAQADIDELNAAYPPIVESERKTGGSVKKGKK